MNDLEPIGGEIAFLRACPQRLAIHLVEVGKSIHHTHYVRLRAARLVSGTIDVEKSRRDLIFIDVALTDAGRRAIGLPIYGGADGDKHA